MGDTITEADVRLFTTLARFDAVYHGHFKCNRQQARPRCRCCGPTRATCSRRPGFGDTIDFDADQAALLRRAHRHQPDPDRPEGPGPVRLADAARPRGARRPAVRRRHAAGSDTRRRAGARRPLRRLGPDGAAPTTRRAAAGTRYPARRGPGRQLHRDAGEPAAARIDGGNGHRAAWCWARTVSTRCRRDPRRPAAAPRVLWRSPAAPTTAPGCATSTASSPVVLGISQSVGLSTSQYRYGPTRTNCPRVYALISGCSGAGVRVNRQIEHAGGGRRHHRDGRQHRQPFLHSRGTAAESLRPPSCAARTGRFPPRPGISESPR